MSLQDNTCNSYKNDRTTPNFKLIKAIGGKNHKYKPNENLSRYVGVRELLQCMDGQAI